MIAAGDGHVDVATTLLRHKAEPNKARTDDGITPLGIATHKGHGAVVDLLKCHGAI